MQRWIVAGVLILSLMCGAGGWYWWQKRKARPDRVWTPIPLNALPAEADAERITKQLEAALRKPLVLERMVKDLDLVERFKVGSEEAAKEELSRRIFIQFGEANPPVDRKPALNIGVSGTTSEHALLQEISARLMQDAEPLLKPKPPGAPAPAAAPF